MPIQEDLLMKWLLPKSIQARMALLIGALVLVAASSAMTGIINSAAFQQELAIVENYAFALQQNSDARSALLKTQIAVKDILISGTEQRAKDYGDFVRFSRQFHDYLYSQTLRNNDNPAVQELLDRNEISTEQNKAFFDELNSPNADAKELTRINREEIDTFSEIMENQMQLLYGQDLETMRSQISAIEERTRINMLVGQITLMVLVFLIIWGVYETMNISTPLDNLTSAIVAFENKTYTPDLLANDVKRADELGQLASAVGGMAQSISESNRLKEQFLQAAQRFIPTQYLEFLEKDNITKVNLGDHVSAEMAVMFSDIRGFTTMSEKMTAQENFDFINEYLKLVSPIIQKHEGFIVKFLGDGMMAIFPYGAADAVLAGIEKSALVQTFNETLKSRGLGSINVGIGVHIGSMMVGMIGEEMRMQGDAFSDNVNLTSRIEGLNKFYGTSMIISEDTLRQIPQPVTFKLRYLGKAVVKGRAAPLGMYEIYEGLSQDVIALKDATRPEFERGIDLYTQGKFAEAGHLFSQVLEKDSSDKTAQIYLESCAEWLDRPLPTGWNGSIVMDSK
jgi:class 3 adenylate cyclase/polyhydroxyalkanoate synthesis regulator phasin